MSLFHVVQEPHVGQKERKPIVRSQFCRVHPWKAIINARLGHRCVTMQRRHIGKTRMARPAPPAKQQVRFHRARRPGRKPLSILSNCLKFPRLRPATRFWNYLPLLAAFFRRRERATTHGMDHLLDWTGATRTRPCNLNLTRTTHHLTQFTSKRLSRSHTFATHVRSSSLSHLRNSTLPSIIRNHPHKSHKSQDLIARSIVRPPHLSFPNSPSIGTHDTIPSTYSPEAVFSFCTAITSTGSPFTPCRLN